MRYRVAFAAGLAVGFMLGARAGRERYEQIRKLARQTWESPSVQQAAGALQAQAADVARTTRGRVADRVPGMASAARGKAGDAVRHIPGVRARGGTRAESDGKGAYAAGPTRPPGGTAEA